MRCAVKTVAADFVAAIKLIRQRVEKRFFGQSLVKRRVENGDLRQTRAENFAGGVNASDIRRIMERRKLDAVFDAAQNFVGNQCRFGKFFAAVNDAMPDGVNVREAFYLVNFGSVGGNPPDNRFDRRFYIPHRRG